MGSSNNEQEDGTEQVTTEQMTTSGTKKPSEINLLGNGRNTGWQQAAQRGASHRAVRGEHVLVTLGL